MFKHPRVVWIGEHMAGYEIAKTPNDEEAMETRMNWGSIFWVSLMHVGAIFSVNYLSTQNVVSLVVMYFLTGCIGITMTYHRMISHRTFVTPKWFERLCATCGALAMQGGPIKWTAIHRQHHSAP
jgi:stearoyl-CoA desaturase (delta-9 desaturase)